MRRAWHRSGASRLLMNLWDFWLRFAQNASHFALEVVLFQLPQERGAVRKDRPLSRPKGGQQKSAIVGQPFWQVLRIGGVAEWSNALD